MASDDPQVTLNDVSQDQSASDSDAGTSVDIQDLSGEGMDTGKGRFKEGTLTRTEDGYHVSGEANRNRSVGAFLETVRAINPQNLDAGSHTPDMEPGETIDVSGTKFQMGAGVLHLFGAIEW